MSQQSNDSQSRGVSKKPYLATIDEIGGLFKTVTTVPTHVPRGVSDQIRVYKNGSTKRLYVYYINPTDRTDRGWIEFTGA